MFPRSPPFHFTELGFTAGIRAAFLSVWGSMLLVMSGSVLGMIPLSFGLDTPMWMWPFGMVASVFMVVTGCMITSFPGWVLLGAGAVSVWAVSTSEDYRLEAKMGLFYSSLFGGWALGFLFWQPFVVLISAISLHVYLRWPFLRYHLRPRVLNLPPAIEGVHFAVVCPCCKRELDSILPRKHPSRFFCPGCGRNLKVIVPPSESPP